MMGRLLLALVMLLTLSARSAHAAEAPVVKINDLIEQAKSYDRQTVTIEGEVIGDVMIRGTQGWINVSDGTNDIGVWAPAEALRTIQYAGRYHHSGDTVRVTGEFRRADPDLGGELNVRAAELAVLASGAPVEHPVKPGRPLWAAVSLAAAGVLGFLRWRIRAVA